MGNERSKWAQSAGAVGLSLCLAAEPFLHLEDKNNQGRHSLAIVPLSGDFYPAEHTHEGHRTDAVRGTFTATATTSGNSSVISLPEWGKIKVAFE
jgi:hypothetical protein